MTTSSHLVPPRPKTPGTTSESTSSPRPPPYGDEVELASHHDHHTNMTSSHPNRTTSPPPIATCQHCHRPIRHGQPYTGRIPFIGSWGGLVHRICPPRLVPS